MSEGATCAQCGRPAIRAYRTEGGNYLPLCLDHCLAYQAVLDHEMDRAARLYNFHSDQMDYVLGLPRSGPRIPERPQPTVIRGGDSLSNISISSSTVGSINTGTIHVLDVAIGTLRSGGQDDSYEAFKKISEAVLAEGSLDESVRKDKIEMLEVLAAEATLPDDQRKKGAMRALLTDFSTWIGGVATLAELWSKYGDHLLSLFR